MLLKGTKQKILINGENSHLSAALPLLSCSQAASSSASDMFRQNRTPSFLERVPFCLPMGLAESVLPFLRLHGHDRSPLQPKRTSLSFCGGLGDRLRLLPSREIFFFFQPIVEHSGRCNLGRYLFSPTRSLRAGIPSPHLSGCT